jgi:hypothetical protein
VKISNARCLTSTALLAAATLWAAPAEAQVSLRSDGEPGGLWTPVAPALLEQARIAGATVDRPTFLLEVRDEWNVRPSAGMMEGIGTTAFDPLDLTTQLRWTASPMPAPVMLMRQLPLSFRVDDVLDSFDDKRALHQVFPGLKSASRVFRLGGSIRF